MSPRNRLFRLFRRPVEEELTIDAPDLAVVAEAFDPAEADSAVLCRSHRWNPARAAVLRHHLSLPAEGIDTAARILAQDGYQLRMAPDQRESGELTRVHAVRVQVLDALGCAQERARMAGLAQRLGGDALGWDALQPPA
ncbi:hypothetical protein [Amycolatopsis taiwanensis]|uniref:hypothetical protein n=1 Tax=Amycolatopsis taiwanensis TaxID=342230 RepID=UPI002557B938|nr:hypothetical protein [Amycolatopsis taiwanensis]